MNQQINSARSGFSGSRGFSIIEVLIGIFIFVVGLLALSALQGALTRSMLDAKVRTTATNIADRILESQRGFTRIMSDTATPKTWQAYNDVVSADTSETVDGVTYSVDMDVTDYYYDLPTDTFTLTAPSGAIASTYKQVEITVTWDAAQNFRTDEGTEIAAADLGSGEIVLTAAIPALVTSASGRVADEHVANEWSPFISYTPGQNPDIVSLDLGGNKFKESLLPEPDVIRADELVETRFDVITYSQTDDGAQFLRREEFAAVSCECTLRAPDEDVVTHRPVIWAGDEYVRGQHAVKAYGESANNSQSSLCNACCRDHHDGGNSADLNVPDSSDASVNTFVPFKPDSERVDGGTFDGDHKHYARSRTGDLTEVTSAGDDYVEACRMVRVDGFFRVAQDFRREDLNVFPNDFLDSSDEIGVYSDYVTGAAASYTTAAITAGSYASSPPCIGASPCTISGPPKQGDYDAAIDLDAGQLPSWTTLPLFTAETQQLRSRGVYIDYMSSDLRNVLDNCDPDTDTADSDNCRSGDVVLDRTGSVNTLELIPFFDVQMTKLNRWNESPTNDPVDATNEPLADQNTHSRGVISKSDDGDSIVDAEGHRGNLGFTDTMAIDNQYDSQLTEADIFVHAGSSTSTPSGITISGSLSETVPGNPSIVITGKNGVQCGQTSVSYSCFIPDGTSTPRLEISAYGKDNTNRWACSLGTSLAQDALNTVTNGTNAKATFNLGSAVDGITNYNFVIEQSDTDPCT